LAGDRRQKTTLTAESAAHEAMEVRTAGTIADIRTVQTPKKEREPTAGGGTTFTTQP